MFVLSAATVAVSSSSAQSSVVRPEPSKEDKAAEESEVPAVVPKRTDQADSKGYCCIVENLLSMSILEMSKMHEFDRLLKVTKIPSTRKYVSSMIRKSLRGSWIWAMRSLM